MKLTEVGAGVPNKAGVGRGKNLKINKRGVPNKAGVRGGHEKNRMINMRGSIDYSEH